MEPMMPLVTPVSAVVILFLFTLWLLNREYLPFELLILILGVVIILIILINPRVIDFWLSLLLVMLFMIVAFWAIYHEQDAVKRQQDWMLAALAGLGIALIWWINYQYNIYGITVTVMLSTESENDESGTLSIDASISAIWEKSITATFESETGAKVVIISTPSKVEERLKKYCERLYANDVDVYAIDVTWPVILAPFAENLEPVFRNSNKFNGTIIENNRVGGKLVAVPWYIDAGLLFYRPNLLKKYGYNKPPDTWDELEKMAQTIQTGERSAEMEQKIQEGTYEIWKSFWGFIWQGEAYEGLTANALEWEVSHGGGLLVDGHNNVDKDPTIDAFARAKGWINTISPPGVLTHTEADTFDIWRQGNAAFMRNWPYAYRASQRASKALSNDVDVTLLPIGVGDKARHASTLGGWQLMVNAASKGKKKKAAIKFVQFMTRPDIQKQLALQTGKVPALKDLYDDDEVQKSLKFLQKLSLKNLFTGDSEDTLVPRPSISTGKKYSDISRTYYGIVHKVLEGKENAGQAVKDLEMELRNILAKPYRPPSSGACARIFGTTQR